MSASAPSAMLALARRQPVEPRVVGGGERHELVDVDAPLEETLAEQQRHAQLDARHAVGHVLEGGGLALGQLARSRRSGRARGRTNRSASVPSMRPRHTASCEAGVARWRRAAVLGAFEAGTVQVLVPSGRGTAGSSRPAPCAPSVWRVCGSPPPYRRRPRARSAPARPPGARARWRDRRPRVSASGSCATPWNFGAAWPRSSRRCAIQRIMSWFSAWTITSAPSCPASASTSSSCSRRASSGRRSCRP